MPTYSSFLSVIKAANSSQSSAAMHPPPPRVPKKKSSKKRKASAMIAPVECDMNDLSGMQSVSSEIASTNEGDMRDQHFKNDMSTATTSSSRKRRKRRRKSRSSQSHSHSHSASCSRGLSDPVENELALHFETSRSRASQKARSRGSDYTSNELPVSAYSTGGVVELTSEQKRRGIMRSEVTASSSNSLQRALRLSASGSSGPVNSEDMSSVVSEMQALAVVDEVLRSQGMSAQESRNIIEQAFQEKSIDRQFAVPVGAMYDPDACAICEETLSFHYRDARIASEAGQAAMESFGTGMSNGAKMRKREQEIAQARSAQMAIANEDSRNHELIYNLETLLRTRISDERIARIMLRLRRNLVESSLEMCGINYVAWTLPMLRHHLNHRNNHQFDPLREAMAEHRGLQDMMDKMKDKVEVPSATNPGVMYVDPRILSEFRQYTQERRKSREHVIDLQNRIDPNVTASLRNLTKAVVNTQQDESEMSLALDPELAAGTIAMGGDARTNAKADIERRGPNSANTKYVINGL